MKRALALVALAFFVAPGAASAHATLLRTTPANGDVLAASPRVVHIIFDDTVRRASGTEAIDNATRRSVLAGQAYIEGHALLIPLQRGLADGDYSVRWSIVSDDGHREEGVLAFAVGAGRSAPRSVLGASTPLGWNDILLRTLYYFGLLCGAGASAFVLLSRRILGRRSTRAVSQLLFFSALAVFLGGSAILHTAPPGTRFALVLKVVVTLALVTGATAALAPMYERLLLVAGAGSIAMLAGPTLSGHALDRDQPALLSVPTDLAHIAGSAVWLGGLVSLVVVLPRATADDSERRAVVRRFSTAAFVSVVVLSVSGLLRALTELGSVSQIWSSGYGRALVVKTALFVPLLGIGWLNRMMLLGVFARLRRSAIVEVTAILGIVVAVAVLTELRPGTARSRATQASAPLQAAGPATLPPRDAVVDAHALGRLAVAVARTPGSATVTILEIDGTGASGRSVLIDGARATACGSGCYRAHADDGPVTVSVDGRSTRFDLPVSAPDATARVRRATAAYRTARSVVFDETLSAGVGSSVTRFTAVRPHRLAYQTRGGASAIVIGTRRWDRGNSRSPFVESAQTPLDVTQPYWTSISNARLIAPNVVTFLDRSLPGWFRVTLGPTLPRQMHMTAAAHFMTDRYVEFDGPATVSPPPSR